MSNSNTTAYVNNQTLVNIANAVRTKTGTNEKMLLSEIPNKIENFEGIVPTGTQTITDNGTYNVSSYASAVVDVQPDLRPLSASENGTYEPDGFDGYSGVNVDVPIPTFETEEKTITLNGNYSAEDDSVDGYSEVTVNVQNGATMTEVQNQYGTELVISSAQGAGPSATRHTIYFEFEDESSTTIYAYYDSAFVGNAITATTPTTYDNKTVTSAQLDGVEWYSYTPTPVGPTYDTIFDDDITVTSGAIAIASLSNLYFAEGETWRVTWAGTEYICQTAIYQGWLWTIGNQSLASTDDGTGEPFCLYNYGGGAMNGNARGEGTVHLKLERQVSA